VEGTVEVLVGGDVARHEVAEAAIAALPELRVHTHSEHQGDQAGQEQDNDPPPSHKSQSTLEVEKAKPSKVGKFRKSSTCQNDRFSSLAAPATWGRGWPLRCWRAAIACACSAGRNR
jgi:hypothetical protein